MQALRRQSQGEAMRTLGRLNTFACLSAFLVMLGMAASPAFAIDGKILGSWSASPKCEDDMTVHIKRNEYSGVEFACRILKTKRDKGGWRATLRCTGEGEEYSQSVHWRMLKNGRLRQSIDGRTIEMRRCSQAAKVNSPANDFANKCVACFNEAQELGRSVGGFCWPDCTDVFTTMICDSKGTNCHLPN
jgi:hypothetical protein